MDNTKICSDTPVFEERYSSALNEYSQYIKETCDVLTSIGRKVSWHWDIFDTGFHRIRDDKDWPER